MFLINIEKLCQEACTETKEQTEEGLKYLLLKFTFTFPVCPYINLFHMIDELIQCIEYNWYVGFQFQVDINISYINFAICLEILLERVKRST